MKYHLHRLAVNSTWHIVVQQSIVAGCDITCLQTQHAGVQGKRNSSSRTAWDEHSETLSWEFFFFLSLTHQWKFNAIMISGVSHLVCLLWGNFQLLFVDCFYYSKWHKRKNKILVNHLPFCLDGAH